MGDRVLMQVVNKDTFSPVIYLHWGGSEALEIAERLKARMFHRSDDLSYAAARLVQEAAQKSANATGVGIWNAVARLTATDTHGDAGVILIHSDENYRAEPLCGYHFKVGLISS